VEKVEGRVFINVDQIFNVYMIVGNRRIDDWELLKSECTRWWINCRKKTIAWEEKGNVFHVDHVAYRKMTCLRQSFRFWFNNL